MKAPLKRDIPVSGVEVCQFNRSACILHAAKKAHPPSKHQMIHEIRRKRERYGGVSRQQLTAAYWISSHPGINLNHLRITTGRAAYFCVSPSVTGSSTYRMPCRHSKMAEGLKNMEKVGNMYEAPAWSNSGVRTVLTLPGFAMPGRTAVSVELSRPIEYA